MTNTVKTVTTKLNRRRSPITKDGRHRIPQEEKELGEIPPRSRIVKALDSIKSHGIPDPWQRFGTLLSKDGSFSTQIVEAVASVRREQDLTSQMHTVQLFECKLENLATARALLRDTMEQYDARGM